MEDRDALSREGLWRTVEALHVASFAWARACAGNEDDAADVLQSAYEKIASGSARFEGRSSVKTWLFGVIRYCALAHRRRRWLRWVWLREEPTVPATQEASSAQGQTARALVEALGRLPERQRQVLHLVFYEDLTVDAAAQAMGISVGSARVHYDRGKKRLAALLPRQELER